MYLQLFCGLPPLLAKEMQYELSLRVTFLSDIQCISVTGARTLSCLCHRYMDTRGKKGSVERGRGGFCGAGARLLAVCGLAQTRGKAARRQLYF